MKSNTQSMMIDSEFSKMELLVTYDFEVIKFTERIEECHGLHSFNEDELNVNITSVELVIGSVGIDITNLLSEKQKSIIEDSLEVK